MEEYVKSLRKRYGNKACVNGELPPKMHDKNDPDWNRMCHISDNFTCYGRWMNNDCKRNYYREYETCYKNYCKRWNYPLYSRRHLSGYRECGCNDYPECYHYRDYHSNYDSSYDSDHSCSDC